MRLFSRSLILPLLLLVGACASRQGSSTAASGTVPLRSEREYAELAETRAQELYRTGQVQTLDEARAQAHASVNMEWAAAARRQQQAEEQAKFEKDLRKSITDTE